MYFISFFLPLIIMIAIFAVRGIYPFGDNVYLRSDMYHQYCPFFSELWDKIRNGGSLFYSWEIGLGSNFPLYMVIIFPALSTGLWDFSSQLHN